MRLPKWVRLPGRTVRVRLTVLYTFLFLFCGVLLLTIASGVTVHTSAAVSSGGPPLTQSGLAAPRAPVSRPAIVQPPSVASQAAQQSQLAHTLFISSLWALAVMTIVSAGLGWLAAGWALRPVRRMAATTRRISEDNLHERLALDGPRDEFNELGDTIDGLLARLEGAFAAQRRFVANASHELRTPLTTIRASLDVALAKPEPAPPQAVALGGRLRIELDKLDALLDAFLVLARTQHRHSEVYWSFNGQEESIAQQPYIDMPANSAGRMYFYLGSPNSAYYDFIEFTVGPSSINVDTTRVDRFGLKLALLLHGHDGSNQEVGEDYATFTETRSATFQRFENSVPTEFKELATDQAPYGIPSPGNDPAFQPGGAYANYYTSYAASAGDTSDSTAQVFGCGGTLASNPPLCAALNRHVAQLPASEQSDPANFYQAAPANYYAQFWHQNAINGLQYGFPYDDDAGQSSDISVSNPQYLVVAVGW